MDLGASSGVVISASHNPPEYNGIKFFAANGMKLPDELEDEIEAALRSPRGPGRGAGLDAPVGRRRATATSSTWWPPPRRRWTA